MKKNRRTARVSIYDEELEDLDLVDQRFQDRTLVIKQPPARKGQLMAQGVKEIRCACCIQIRPIAGAEEYHPEGWICEDCLSEAMQNRKFGT